MPAKQTEQVTDHLVRKFLRISKALSLIAMIFPLLAIIGWYFRIPLLTQGHPALPAMQPHTAVCLFLISFATLLSGGGKRNRFQTILISGLALVVATYGVLTFGNFFWNWTIWDESFAARPSPQTSANFVLLGVSVLFYEIPWISIRWAQLMTIIASSSGIISMTGYIFSSRQLHGFPIYASTIGMAINSALAFILISGALMASRPREGLMTLIVSDTRSGNIARRLLFACIIIPMIAGALTRAGVALGLYDTNVQFSLFVLILIGVILKLTWSAARNAESEELKSRAVQIELYKSEKKLIRDVIEHKKREAQLQLLSKVSKALSESIDYEETINRVVKIVVPEIADGCVVRLFTDGEFRVVGVRHRDPVKEEIMKEMAIRAPKMGNVAVELKQAIALGKAIIVNKQSPANFDISEEDRRVREEHQKIMGVNSYAVIPLMSGEDVIGTMSFTADESKRRFDDMDASFFDALSRRVAVSIENARLYQAAQRAIKSREEVLSVVSHDLKNPLAAIDLIVRLLGQFDQIGKEELGDFLNRIQRSTDQMHRLIGDLLELAQIEAKTFSVEKNVESLKDVVQPVLDMVTVQAEAKQLKLEIDIPETLPEVACDSHRISQVLCNLIGNAIKFTPEEGKVRVEAKPLEGQVVVSVTDTGPGIPSDNLLKIFDRFWQADSTKHLGTGLGLAIAKGIVCAHGGRIWADSEEGKGSTFQFTIPLATPDMVRATGPKPAAEPSVWSRPPLDGIHVMLVDDSADVVYLLKSMLEDAGAKVTEANSVAEAMTKLKLVKPDVLLTDIEMPGETGLDLINKVHHLTPEEGGNIPIAAMTAYTRREELQKIKAAGFDIQLSKPMDFEETVAAVKQLAAKPTLVH